jgi:hypothetical protein
MDMGYVEGDFIVEMETCMKHGEILAKRCRQCEIEMFGFPAETRDELVKLAEAYLDELDFAVPYTFTTLQVFDAGKVLAAAILLTFKEPPELTVRGVKKEDFKVNAWHKPPND